MPLLKNPESLGTRAEAIGSRLERLIQERKPNLSAKVVAPFKPSDGTARSFTDAPWLGEWGDADNY